MTDKKYLQDDKNNVYWPMTAYDAVVGLNMKQFKDDHANYQKLGNVVTVEFNGVDSSYTVPTDYRPVSKQTLRIDANNTLTIDINGLINTTNSQKVSGIFNYFVN